MKKKISGAVEVRLRRKKIAIVDYIYHLREGREITLKKMAELMDVKLPYLSRILSGPGTNITLETIAKCEEALSAEIVVCPGDYEERLIDNPDRLWRIVEAALQTNSAPYLRDKVATAIQLPAVGQVNSRPVDQNPIFNFPNVKQVWLISTGNTTAGEIENNASIGLMNQRLQQPQFFTQSNLSLNVKEPFKTLEAVGESRTYATIDQV